MRDAPRIRALNAPVDLATFDEALDRAVALARDRGKVSRVVAVNPEKAIAARSDPFLQAFLDESDLAIPDGVGVVAAARILQGAKCERVTGVDLATALCEASGARDLKLFFYGAKEEVNALMVEKLRARFPDIQIVGRENGYFPLERSSELCARVNASGADVLFVALGSPKQERWIAEHAKDLRVGLCMGVGGTFDALAGTVKRAPKAWRALRLEWLHRLVRQPSRFWRQRRIFLFAFLVLWTKIFGARVSTAASRRPIDN